MVDQVTSSWYWGIIPRDSVHSVERESGDDVVDSDPSDVNLPNAGSGDVSDGHVSDDVCSLCTATIMILCGPNLVWWLIRSLLL